MQRACFHDDDAIAIGERLDVPRVRAYRDRNHADQRLYFFLQLSAVPCDAATYGRGLRRVLLLRIGALSTDPAKILGLLPGNTRADTTMNRHQHWQAVYATTSFDAVSWYREHLDKSLALIERATPDRGAAILDVGGGASTLVDDLLLRGYRDISVLDISDAALGVARRRLGNAAPTVTWLAVDLLDAPLATQRYDVWHDRAVFHFLTEAEQRANYVRQLMRALKPGAYAILATFGPDGPLKCSGLDTLRYAADGLACALGDGFVLIDSFLDWHATPSVSTQQFLYALFRRHKVSRSAANLIPTRARFKSAISSLCQDAD